MPQYDASWSSQDLAREVCDVLVAKGQLKEKPAFIRGDRQDKIATIFEGAGLDGAKMGSYTNTGPLEVGLRKATNGEAWVQQVQEVLISMLPASVASAAKEMGMDEGTKDELQIAREKTAARRERMAEERGGKGDGDEEAGGRKGGGRKGGYDDDRGGGGGRFDRDDRGDRADRGGGRFDLDDQDRGKGSGRAEMECYNCNTIGHSARDCPEPRKDKGGGKGRRYDRASQPCYNCGVVGHRSRDCPEPQKQLHKDRNIS